MAYQACAYARIRYTKGDDYKRAERQRTVLAAMVAKAQKSDLVTINKLIDAVFGDIQTSFSNTDLVALAAQYLITSLVNHPDSHLVRIQQLSALKEVWLYLVHWSQM